MAARELGRCRFGGMLLQDRDDLLGCESGLLHLGLLGRLEDDRWGPGVKPQLEGVAAGPSRLLNLNYLQNAVDRRSCVRAGNCKRNFNRINMWQCSSQPARKQCRQST